MHDSQQQKQQGAATAPRGGRGRPQSRGTYSGLHELSARDDEEGGSLFEHVKHAIDSAAQRPDFDAVPTDAPEGSQDQDMHHHPERVVHPLLRPLLFWLNPLIDIARAGRTSETDIWDAPDDASVATNTRRVQTAWAEEQERLRQAVGCEDQNQNFILRYFTSVWLRVPPFGRAILRAYRRDVLVGALYQLCFAALQLTLPFIIGNVIAYLNSGGGDMSYGVGMVFALGIVSTLSSYAIILTFYNMRRTGVCIKAGVMMATYQHALRLSVAARQSSSVGQTTNLMSIDCDKIAMASQYLHFLWHGPLVALCVMAILCAEVGEAAAVAGVLFLLVVMPVQHKVALRVGTMRRRMVKFTDQRVKLTNEILQVIRVIKYYAWEPSVEQRIEGVRLNETTELWSYLVANGLLRELLFLAIPISAFLIFSTYVMVDQPMSVVKVFRVLAYLNTLRFPMNLFGQAMKFVSDAGVSIVRLNDFFNLPTQPLINRRKVGGSQAKINICDASFEWQNADSVATNGNRERLNEVSNLMHTKNNDEGAMQQSGSFRLNDINVNIGPTELVGIVGAVGSGKSSFMSAVLGDMPLVVGGGRCDVVGAVAYCAQTPWIQNMSLRDNILFGQSIESDDTLKSLYSACIEQAALLPDLAILPNGDDTEIGERGINLSGGQKARVSFARALMAAPKSNIMLFDDPFSAVDRTTGDIMFSRGIVGALSDKLRMVVLNSHMHLIPQFDRVIMMEGGKIIAFDTPLNLSASSQFGPSFRRMTGLSEDMQIMSRGSVAETPLPLSNDTAFTDSETAEKLPGTSTAGSAKIGRSKSGILIASEKKQTGKIDRSVYTSYFGSCIWNDVTGHPTKEEMSQSFILMFAIMMLFTGAQVMRVGVDLILVLWAKSGSNLYYTAYALCLVGLAVLVLLRMVGLNSQAVRSSRALHKAVFHRVLAAPIPTFFDTHTVGEVLNRFGKDMEIVDTSIPEFFLQFLINWFQVSSIFILCIWSTPFFLLIAVPLIYVFYKIYVNFSAVSRDLKRLESISRSPVYASFSETLSGLDTIRAYDATKLFVERHLGHMNKNQKISYHLTMCMCWVTSRLELMVSFVMFAVSLLAVLAQSSVSSVGVGMALVYCLQLTALFQRCVQLSIDVQTYFTSAERILEYVAVPSEPSVLASDSGATVSPIHVDNVTTRDNANAESCKMMQYWPNQGSVEFDSVVLRYRDNDPVLKGISFKVEGGTRVGICGRTGAGKSTIMVALFRICNVLSGAIRIDGVDIRTVPLYILRRRIAIIPQDPVLFSGTIRNQLDPFEEYTDADIWDALDQTLMGDYVRGMPGGLGAEVSESGDNLSQGQRQLLCIARAMLRKCRILVMDEATSAIDPATDMLIQDILKENSLRRGTTVLTIAHRLQTCEDYDFIMTLSDGKVVEFDSPMQLLSNPNSTFHKMYNGI